MAVIVVVEVVVNVDEVVVAADVVVDDVVGDVSSWPTEVVVGSGAEVFDGPSEPAADAAAAAMRTATLPAASPLVILRPIMARPS